MTLIEAILLGLVQGLTEFLPVSSSGHIEIGSAFLDVKGGNNLLFSVIVHGATALSTVVIFRKFIWTTFKDALSTSWNESHQFVIKILISMIPVGIVGIFFKDAAEEFFGGHLTLVSLMLIITGLLLTFSYFARPKEGEISYFKSFIIGIAQAIAVLPGISRSGATISTALMLGVDKRKATAFSFLMVLPPILGATLLEVLELVENTDQYEIISIEPLVAGFIAAFLAGLFACNWMIKIVQKGKLIYFAVYCYIVGGIVLLTQWL